jgi:hypothetical protein
MKLIVVTLCLCLSACATRYVADTSTWYADCYNKQRQEAMLARAESHLRADDIQERRRVRKMFWELQRECQSKN